MEEIIVPDSLLNKDGIIQETATNLITSVSSLLLVIDESDNGCGDEENVQVIGPTGTFALSDANQEEAALLPDLSFMMVTDLSGTSEPVMEQPPLILGLPRQLLQALHPS